MNVNFMGYVNTTKYTIPHLIKTKGQIVVVSSASGIIPFPARTAYCASKFAVEGFYKSLRYEMDGKIDITLVSPTSIPGTNFRNNSLAPP